MGSFALLPQVIRCSEGMAWPAKPTLDFPVPTSGQQYVLEQGIAIARLQAIVPDIVVFDFGIVGTPGISDIDLLCFVPDNIDAARLNALFSIEWPRLFTHEPIMLPKSTLAQVRWLLPISDLRLVAGSPDIDLPPPLLPAQQASLALLDCCNSSLTRWKGFRISRNQSQMKVHKVLLNLWSARHSIVCAEIAGLSIRSRWTQFMDRAADQRAIWREEHRVDRDLLLWLLDEVEAVLTEVVEASAAAIKSQVAIDASDGPMADGRSVVAGSSVGAGWSCTRFVLMVKGRKRFYNLLEVPAELLPLLRWRPKGATSLDEAARARIEITRRRAELSQTGSDKNAVLAARLFEERAPSFHKHMIDRIALRSILRQN